MFVQTEITPNPNSLKFIPGKVVSNTGSFEVTKKDNINNELIKTSNNCIATLEARPWEKCDCKICKDIGVEVIIFRGNNRNRRRGFHNLYVYNKHLSEMGH